VGRRTSAPPLASRSILRPLARAGVRDFLVLLVGTLGLAFALSLGTGRAEARSHHRSSATTESDGGASLTDPVERAEIRKMLDRIAANGPFRHRQDGVVFGNREGRLPAKANGFYHEYTVETPGAYDRGARRIIRGQSGETYYTRDHYRTFLRLNPETFR
jgi:ribonuclease T1